MPGGHPVNVSDIGDDSRIQSCPNPALPVIGKTVVVHCSMKPDDTPHSGSSRNGALLLSTFQCYCLVQGLKRDLTVADAHGPLWLMIDWKENIHN